jgi:hypothetical protein
MPHQRFNIWSGRIRFYTFFIFGILAVAIWIFIKISQLAYSTPLPNGEYVKQPDWLATSAFAVTQPVQPVSVQPTLDPNMPLPTVTASAVPVTQQAQSVYVDPNQQTVQSVAATPAGNSALLGKVDPAQIGTGEFMYCNPDPKQPAALLDQNGNPMSYSYNCIVRKNSWRGQNGTFNGVDYFGMITENGIIYVPLDYNMPNAPRQ